MEKGNKEKKKTVVFIITISIIAIVIIGTFIFLGINKKEKESNSFTEENVYLLEDYEPDPITRASSNTNKIHYISNGDQFTIPVVSNGKTKDLGRSPSNTIVLESNGHFALIDTGLKTDDDPKHVDLILNYLKKIGAKKLDFILITHDHYDHIGGLNQIIDKIPVDVVYIKPYYSHDGDGSGDVKNRTNYANLLQKYFGSSFSCNEKCLNNADKYREAIAKVDKLYGKKQTNVGKLKITSMIYKINANAEGKQIGLGSMTLTLYNATNLSYHSECYGNGTTKFDENSNSIVTYIKMGSKTALIAGDLEKISKTCYNAIYEKYYGKCTESTCSIMKYVTNKIAGTNKTLSVDLLELPHHGYSSCDMPGTIKPKTIVIPNWKEKIDYYYSTNGPYNGKTACYNKYFKNFSGSKYYVGSNNYVFDFSNNNFDVNKN